MKRSMLIVTSAIYFFSLCSYGTVISYVTDPVQKNYNGTLYEATLTTIIDLPHSNLTVPSGVTDMGICKYPYGSSSGCVGAEWPNTGTGNTQAALSRVTVTPGESLNDALQKWINKNGNPVSFRSLIAVTTASGQRIEDVCYGLMFGTRFRVISTVPGATCGKVPPVDNQCNFNVDNTNFNFTGSPDNLDGQHQEKSVIINCTKSSTVNIRMTSYPIKLASNLTAGINLDGTPFISNRRVAIPSNGKQMSIGVTLSGTADAGSYSGSEIFIIDIE